MSNSPAIYAGKRTKLLTSQGPLLQSWQTLDYDGQFNCVSNSNGASGSIQNWNAYAETPAAAIPVAGTGGSPTVSIGIDTTTTLTLGGSFHIQKDLGNRQGQGVSIDFNIPQFIVGGYNQVSFIVKSSAAYVAGDVVIYLYDRDSSTLITPSVVSMPASARGGVVLTQFTCPVATSGSYRLIFHVATTSNAAWDLWLDRIYCGPGQLVQGAAVGSPISYTSTLTNAGNATQNFTYTRVGSRAFIVGDISLGSSLPTGTVKFTLPTGMNSTVSSHLPVGNAFYYDDTGGKVFVGKIFKDDASTRFLIQTALGNVENWDATHPMATPHETDVIHIEMNPTIDQWSANVILGSEATEFASNSSSTDGDDTTSFVNGPQGGLIPTVATSATGTSRTKRVQFTQPVQPTDYVVVEIQDSGVGPWIPVGQSYSYQPFGYQKSTGYGIGWQQFSSTQFDVLFLRGGRLMSGTNYGDAGAAFPHNASDRWRVRKVSAPALVGFNVANTSNPVGLINLNTPQDLSSSTAGVKVEATRVSPSTSDTQNVYSGSYTPSLANVANTSGLTPYLCYWYRVGGMVTVFGRVDANNSGNPAQFNMTLPITPSAFTATTQAAGTCSASTVTGNTPGYQIVSINGDTKVLFSAATGPNNGGFMFQFSYRL
jgi:hypothetical protein